jgi:galactokinase
MTHDWAERLRAAGMSEAAAAAKGELFARAERALAAAGASSPSERRAFFVPGRVEVLGKHTDYAGGRSLLAAVERGICLVALGRADRTVRVLDALSGEAASFPLDPALDPAVGHWATYPMTVARRIARNFPEARRGADLALASDLPAAAGMSSSSALVVAVFLALADVNEIQQSEPYRRELRSREELAAYLGCVENGESFGSLAGDRGVGTFGGSEDHVAMLCCAPGVLSQYAFSPVRLERSVPLPEDHALVIAVSGVAAEKIGAARDAYNRAALAARAILMEWRTATGDAAATLGAVVARGPETLARLTMVVEDAVRRGAVPAALRARLAQFRDESEAIVPAASDALARGDVAAFGALVDRSQDDAERLLGNQIAETVHLARSARELGAAAASAFGAGFGGSVWALVRAADAGRFVREWRDAYGAAFPERRARAEVFVTRPGPAALRLPAIGARLSGSGHEQQRKAERRAPSAERGTPSPLPRKAVVLARGLGTRMRARDGGSAITREQAAVADRGVKAMIPLAGSRPFLDYALAALGEAGFTDVCLVIGPEHHAIREYYSRTVIPRRLRIRFAIQEEPLGTADAVLAAEPFIAGEPFLVLNADNYYPPEVLAALRRASPPATPAFARDGLLRDGQIPPDRIARYALLDVGPDGALRRIVEKPDETDLRALRDAPVSMNCWLLTPAMLEACRRVPPSPRGELELPLAVQYAIDALGVRVHALPVDAPVLDLSHRADIPAVAARLEGVEVEL